MGYTTDFRGEFTLDKPLDKKTKAFLVDLANTRRMKRSVEGFGVEGEFFIKGKGFMGQDVDATVLDNNRPPSTQPGLWCQWVPNHEGDAIEWDGGEKFYNYIEWLAYIIHKVLKPNGYVIGGSVEWRGEDWDDTGDIDVEDNVIRVNGEVYKPDYDKMQVDVVFEEGTPMSEEERKKKESYLKNLTSQRDSLNEEIEKLTNELG